MAADAAHLAGLGAGPSGSARGHRAHRRVSAEQDVVRAILTVAPLALTQRKCSSRRSMISTKLQGRLAVVELVHQGISSTSASLTSGEWNDDDYDVLADGVVVRRDH
jgi:hypothetical protein